MLLAESVSNNIAPLPTYLSKRARKSLRSCSRVLTTVLPQLNRGSGSASHRASGPNRK